MLPIALLLTLGSAHAQDAEAPAAAQSAAEAPQEDAEPGDPATAPAAEPWQKQGWGFGGLPAVAYNSDDGLGGGVVGNIYRYDGITAPYKAEIYFLFYVTTKQVHTHRVQLDMLEVGGLPLRITTRAEFSLTRSGNYCGTSVPGDCSIEQRDTLLEQYNLSGTELEDAERRFYKTRFKTPLFFFNARYGLKKGPPRLEAFGTVFAQYILPGDFQEDSPWDYSLYGMDFPGGEQGLDTMVQAGLMLDNRDNEPSPKRGYWVEGSLRTSIPGVSDWDYWGFNTTLRGYTPLGTERVILADRFVADGIIGDAPTMGMSRAGGATIYEFYGGQRAGRGVRLRRVIGKARFMNQTEIRATVWSPQVGPAQIDVTPVVFLDSGYWASEWSDLGTGQNEAFVWGTGGGLRLAFNKNFIIRADVGVSPLEDYSPSVYIDIYNLF
ncbi:MAG: BamA/TamA family outer membrane protein [Myxococcota bacterium]|nr:BamA/TamA family outer membrane protein [Myxococcota bacterium]